MSIAASRKRTIHIFRTRLCIDFLASVPIRILPNILLALNGGLVSHVMVSDVGSTRAICPML